MVAKLRWVEPNEVVFFKGEPGINKKCTYHSLGHISQVGRDSLGF